ncbi:retrovirus-related pol polyprotein from transposon TNT 1-94 [Tanacetum coccineum]
MNPLYIASSDHIRMVLTNTPFNGTNFHGWNRNVRMVLGAKLKLGFIDGSCPKPGAKNVDLQRWIRMRECTCDVLGKVLLRDSNSKLIKFSMKLNDDYESVRSQILAMDPLPTVNKAYYIVQQIEKQKQVTNHSFEPTAFFANLNNKGGNGGRKDNKGSRNDGKNDGKRFCNGCHQEGHTVDQCFEKIGYPDWYKGKKAKKQGRIAANVSLGFDDHFSADTPFDMGYENEIGTNSGGGVDQRLVAAVCQEMMKMFKGKGGDNGISRDHASTSHAGILSCCTASFALFCHPHMDIKEDWINDTWASDHMTPNFDLFISITHLKNPIIIHLPDGNSKTVIIVGKVQLTPSLILTNVFYVPEFQLNLLSVGQLTQNHNLSAHFYSNDYCFQDPSTK